MTRLRPVPRELHPGLVRSREEEGGVCPHIALSRTSQRANYAPDGDNRCLLLWVPDRIPIETQERFCLSSHHRHCSVFRGVAQRPPRPPRALSRFAARKLVAIFLFAITIPAAGGVSLALVLTNESLARSTPDIPDAVLQSPAVATVPPPSEETAEPVASPSAVVTGSPAAEEAAEPVASPSAVVTGSPAAEEAAEPVASPSAVVTGSPAAEEAGGPPCFQRALSLADRLLWRNPRRQRTPLPPSAGRESPPRREHQRSREVPLQPTKAGWKDRRLLRKQPRSPRARRCPPQRSAAAPEPARTAAKRSRRLLIRNALRVTRLTAFRRPCEGPATV